MSERLKVTTWNILAPVWANPKLYPTMSIPFLDPAQRRKIIAAKLHENKADIVGMEEVQQSEIEAMQRENPFLGEEYHVLYVSSEPSLWADWGTWTKPQPNGLCLLLRRSRFLGKPTVETIEITPTDGLAVRPSGAGNHAVAVSTTTKGGAPLMCVVCHLDATSPSLAGRQVFKLSNQLEKLLRESSSKPSLIWFGDFNLELNSVGLTHIREKSEFVNAACDTNLKENAGIKRVHSCFGMAGSARVDHIYVTKDVNVFKASLPENDLPYLFGTAHVHNFGLGLVDMSKVYQVLLLLLLIILLPITIVLAVVLMIAIHQSKKRSKWALEEWGSDHLPLTVELEVSTPKVIIDNSVTNISYV